MSAETAAATTQPVSADSIKRQRRFLLVTSIAFSLWVVAMLVMYFTTVYPQRHLVAPAAVSTVR